MVSVRGEVIVRSFDPLLGVADGSEVCMGIISRHKGNTEAMNPPRTYRRDVYNCKSEQVQTCPRALRLHGQGVDNEVGMGHEDGSRGRPRRHASKLRAVISRRDRGLTFEFVNAAMP